MKIALKQFVCILGPHMHGAFSSPGLNPVLLNGLKILTISYINDFSPGLKFAKVFKKSLEIALKTCSICRNTVSFLTRTINNIITVLSVVIIQVNVAI